MNCVAETMFRITTRSNAGFARQYRGFWSSTIWDVVLYCLRTYGPLPAPTEAGELNHRSALSVLAALGPSVAPCRLASLEFTIPRDVFATIDGIAVFGVLERSTTVYRPRAEGVTPESRNAGLPLRLIRRRNENTTSAAVIGVPSANRMSRRRSNVYVLPPPDAR